MKIFLLILLAISASSEISEKESLQSNNGQSLVNIDSIDYWICYYRANYKCVIQGKNLVSNETYIKIVGDHLGGKNNSDVNELQILTSEIRYVPSEIFKTFGNLKIATFHDLKVREIKQKTFINATKLEVLDMGDNLIVELIGNAFLGAINLREINLDHGVLRNISDGAFDGLENLEVLNLSNNKIKKLDDHILNPLKSLKTINLSGNQLKFIPKNIFQKNPRLSEIYLNNNKISAMSNNMFNNLKNLNLLYLADNLCISEYFEDVRSKIGMIEQKLTSCAISYLDVEVDDLKTVIKDGVNIENIGMRNRNGTVESSVEKNEVQSQENQNSQKSGNSNSNESSQNDKDSKEQVDSDPSTPKNEEAKEEN